MPVLFKPDKLLLRDATHMNAQTETALLHDDSVVGLAYRAGPRVGSLCYHLAEV